MTISDTAKLFVRQRANFACEYCGVTEVDCGGYLTIDHFQPRTKGGTDDVANLIYACPRCNQYKQDYWPTNEDELTLWHPRHEPAAQHFIELEDGVLQPLTACGLFTLKRLRLNRPLLVNYRLRQRQLAEEIRLLTQYHNVVQLLAQLNVQLTSLLEEQNLLLEEQQVLLRLFLKQDR